MLDRMLVFPYAGSVECTASAGTRPTVTARRGASDDQTGSFADPSPLQLTVQP